MILFLHNRYRTTGGEERAVEDLLWLVRERLGEDAELLARDSSVLGRPRAAVGLLRGGLDADDVAAAVRRTKARAVHAHNLLPAFGWRALAAARAAGARVVLHLHNYRLVCAVGTCFTRDGDCVRCHGRNTLPGVRLNCRGTGPEAAVYGASLALWQRRMGALADAIVVPSAFAHARLRELGAPLAAPVRVVPHVVREIATQPRSTAGGPALVVSRLAREKGVEVAIDACRSAAIPLVVAGDGPLADELRARAAGADVRFAGRVPAAELAALRARASVAIVPSRAAETFGLAAAEAMAAGLPVAATRSGALPELVPPEQLAAPGDAAALGALAARLRGDAEAGRRGWERVRATSAPEAVAPRLAEVYGAG
ncbi:MAG TPA: glycosyltransferase [Solirubrobacteraceae bacterium]|nr:glycosyltransferase [Solirubrobacteraceae bacterium]